MNNTLPFKQCGLKEACVLVSLVKRVPRSRYQTIFVPSNCNDIAIIHYDVVGVPCYDVDLEVVI